MRRSDKQIADQDEIKSILENNTICRIAFSENNNPYLVPMNYGYYENKMYLHSAKEGKKIKMLETNNQICFEITDSIEIVESKNACNFGTKYRSVIGFGKMIPVSDTNEKQKALQVLMKQHTNKDNWQFPEKMMEKIIILEIRIESLTGKKSSV